MNLVDEIMEEADLMASRQASYRNYLDLYDDNPCDHLWETIINCEEDVNKSKFRLRELVESLAQESKAEAWRESHEDECEYLFFKDCEEFHPNPYEPSPPLCLGKHCYVHAELDTYPSE